MTESLVGRTLDEPRSDVFDALPRAGDRGARSSSLDDETLEKLDVFSGVRDFPGAREVRDTCVAYAAGGSSHRDGEQTVIHGVARMSTKPDQVPEH